MGYRSEVLIVSDKEEFNFPLKVLLAAQDMLRYCEVTEDKQTGRTTYVWNDVKWYEGYTGVDAIMEFLHSQENDEDFGFIRIGEEDGDIELLGSPYDFECYVETRLQY